MSEDEEQQMVDNPVVDNASHYETLRQATLLFRRMQCGLYSCMFDNPEFIVLRDKRLGSWFIDECENDKRRAVDCIGFCLSRAS